jgi:hypothetical protein
MNIMKSQNKIKKTILVLAAIIGLHLSTIYAGNIGEETNGTAIWPPESRINIAMLAPITPTEAEFEEEGIQPEVISPEVLAPVPPKTADFDDEA